jgi:hypothetical protein
MNLKRKALHPHIKVTVEEALNARSPVDVLCFKKEKSVFVSAVERSQKFCLMCGSCR